MSVCIKIRVSILSLQSFIHSHHDKKLGFLYKLYLHVYMVYFIYILD